MAAVDLGGSRAIWRATSRAGFALRSRLDRALDLLPETQTVVLTSGDGRLARLAAAERGGGFACLDAVPRRGPRPESRSSRGRS